MVPGETKYMMLSLNANDRIRMIDAPSNVTDSVRQCIKQYWPGGIQDERNHLQNLSCYEFKLRGYPWDCSGPKAVGSRLLITVILQSLVSQGWAVVSALDISRKVNDKAVFVFRSCPPASIPHFCISPNGTDKIRLVNCPQDITETAINLIRTNWPHGIRREGVGPGCYEMKLNGMPWEAYSGNDYAHARFLMCLLMQTFATMGWRVICSADVSASYVSEDKGEDYPIDVHSWFFALTAPPAAQAGAPPPDYKSIS